MSANCNSKNIQKSNLIGDGRGNTSARAMASQVPTIVNTYVLSQAAKGRSQSVSAAHAAPTADESEA